MPVASFRLALAQASPVPGDVDANARAAGTTIAAAAERGAHLVVFPELFLTGYDLPLLAETPRAWLDERDPRLDPVAVGICFDAAHPGHAERATRSGADLYVGSALYVRGEERRSDLHFGARAMDNRVFAALANYAGTTGGHVSCGLSGVWGPSGDVVECVTGAEIALLVVDLDPAKLARYR